MHPIKNLYLECIKNSYDSIIRRNNKVFLKNGLKIKIDISQKKKIDGKYLHMKRYLTSLVIKEMQIKSTMSFNYTPINLSKMQKTDHRFSGRIVNS